MKWMMDIHKLIHTIWNETYHTNWSVLDLHLLCYVDPWVQVGRPTTVIPIVLTFSMLVMNHFKDFCRKYRFLENKATVTVDDFSLQCLNPCTINCAYHQRVDHEQNKNNGANAFNAWHCYVQISLVFYYMSVGYGVQAMTFHDSMV